MFASLAQIQIPNLPVDPPTLPLPSMEQVRQAVQQALDTPVGQFLWDQASKLEYLQAVVLLAAGLVYLLYGWKIFRALIVINAAIAGVWLGFYVGRFYEVPWWTPIAAGAGLALLSWPLVRYAIALMGGMAGSFIGVTIARSLALEQTAVLIAGTAGLLLVGVLAFVVMRYVVITLTCVQGAIMTVAGILAILAQFPQVAEPVHQAILAKTFLAPMLVGVPAAIGLIYQLSRGNGQEKK